MKYQKNVILLENAIDSSSLQKSNKGDLTAERPIRIVYMGTATHDADLAFIDPVIQRLSTQFENRIAFEVIGVTRFRALPQTAVAVAVPYPANKTYPAFLAWFSGQTRWDIGIAPLIDTDFNQAKSAIKAFDYMALGLAVIVSDVPAYRDLAEQAVCRVKNDAEAWYSALSELIDDSERRRALADEGQRWFFANHTLAAQYLERLKVWESAIVRSSSQVETLCG